MKVLTLPLKCWDYCLYHPPAALLDSHVLPICLSLVLSLGLNAAMEMLISCLAQLLLQPTLVISCFSSETVRAKYWPLMNCSCLVTKTRPCIFCWQDPHAPTALQFLTFSCPPLPNKTKLTILISSAHTAIYQSYPKRSMPYYFP